MANCRHLVLALGKRGRSFLEVGLQCMHIVCAGTHSYEKAGFRIASTVSVQTICDVIYRATRWLPPVLVTSCPNWTSVERKSKKEGRGTGIKEGGQASGKINKSGREEGG